ncbi:uncharacterized protein LOC120005940 [Tripterygium wilfordii]|uniref:uncharacterized protein LOC120005940 n=1 Tax=Tripterygium wilfordii TaxID=458696 RepID=UPI0018F84A77|nr:uncharacterized protein LOC120005940 [Tripterygium wilfordii]
MVRLASRASEDKEAFALVERLMEDLEKQVDNILVKTKSAPHHSDKPVENNNLSQEGGLMEKVKGLKRRIVRKGGKRPRGFMELNARRKATKKKSSTRQAAQDPRSSTQVASSSCTPQDVGGLDTPSSNGVAFYGYNPQRNVQGLPSPVRMVSDCVASVAVTFVVCFTGENGRRLSCVPIPVDKRSSLVEMENKEFGKK